MWKNTDVSKSQWLAWTTAQEVERFGSGERRPQVGFAGHMGETAVRLHGLTLAVEPEDLGPTGGGPGQPQQQANRGGLPAPSGPS